MTLIEILVAITLMGLLATAMVTALTMGAGSWQQARTRLTLDRRIATANEIFYAEFEALVPVMTQSDTSRESPIPRAPFFQGDPESMRFVSSYSLRQGLRGGLRIVELQITAGDRGRRIILNEAPYNVPQDLGGLITGVDRDPAAGGVRLRFAPIQPRGTSLVVADELEGTRFSYLRLPRNRAEPALWVPQWNDLNRLPGAIRVEMIPKADSGRLLPVTVTAPVHARSVTAGAPGAAASGGGAGR